MNNEYTRLLPQLSTTHFCDVYPKIRVLSSAIFPITSNQKIFGRAFTVKANGNAHNVLRALHLAQKNDVLIVSTEKTTQALAGEIFATIAKRKKLAGIIIDGSCRDPDGIRKVNLPFYARGIYPVVAHNKKAGQFQKSIICGGVTIRSGEIIFGDESGIVVLSTKEFERFLPAALAILQRELRIFKGLKRKLDLPKIFTWVDFDEKL